MAENRISLAVDGRTIALSNPDKVLFPNDGITKRALAEYYARIGETVLPFIEERALTMQRFPDGVDREGFFQKQAPDHFPDWIDRATLAREGGETTYVVANSVGTLVYLADQGCITLHAALSRTKRPDHPDRLVFDLDPPSEDFDEVRRAALRLGERLEAVGLTPFVKLTGSKGLHVEAPLDCSAPFDETRAFARATAEAFRREAPERLTTEQRKEARGGRVYIDYLRNAYGQTTVAPYAVRAIDGAPVAAPLDWEELRDGSLTPRRYTVDNIFRRLGQKKDPWSDFFRRAGSISLARSKL